MTAIRTVFFDIGSTLVDGPADAPARRIGRLLGLTGDEPRLLEHGLLTRPFSGPDEVLGFVRSSFGGVPSAADGIVREVWEAQHEEASPIPGAAAAVDALVAAGLRIGLVSNIWEPYLHAARRCLPGVFAVVPEAWQLLSFREGTAKPAPELYRRALAAAEVPPEAAAMVGDSYARDVRPARDLGMATVWVLRRLDRESGHLGDVEAGAEPPPTRMVERIDEVTADLVVALGEDDGDPATGRTRGARWN